MTGTLADLATGTYTVTRASGPGTYVEGVYVPTGTAPVSISAAIVPLLGGPQLLRLPEGKRSIDAIEVFTATALQVEAPDQEPDVISYQGRSWQVDVVDDWSGAGAFYRALATRVPEE